MTYVGLTIQGQAICMYCIYILYAHMYCMLVVGGINSEKLLLIGYGGVARSNSRETNCGRSFFRVCFNGGNPLP
jgi:hypothetical protein